MSIVYGFESYHRFLLTKLEQICLYLDILESQRTGTLVFLAMASAFIINKVFDFFKNNIAKGTKAASNKHTTPTSEAKNVPLKEGVLGQVKASATAEAIENSALSNGVDVVRKVGSIALDGLTVFADSFRELLLSEIRRTFAEMWLSTQILMSTPQFRKVSLGQVNVEGHTYDMFMRVRATNLDKAIGIVSAILNIATTLPNIGKNLLKRGYNHARGKVDDLIKQYLKRQCFIAGTKVHTKDGLKNIEDVKIGDQVLSKDDKTGKTKFKTVTQLFKNNDKHIYNVNIMNANGEKEYLGVTSEHPFWVDGKGWVETKNLKLSDKLINTKGELVSIISKQFDSELQDTYNFEVEDFHTYFVGDEGVWVHNNCIGLDELADRRGFTVAGRSLTKHGVGSRQGNSLFPQARGNPSAINQQAQNLVEDILTDPGTRVLNSFRGRFGNTIEHISPSGRGIVFDSRGRFLFFRE